MANQLSGFFWPSLERPDLCQKRILPRDACSKPLGFELELKYYTYDIVSKLRLDFVFEDLRGQGIQQELVALNKMQRADGLNDGTWVFRVDEPDPNEVYGMVDQVRLKNPGSKTVLVKGWAVDPSTRKLEQAADRVVPVKVFARADQDGDGQMDNWMEVASGTTGTSRDNLYWCPDYGTWGDPYYCAFWGTEGFEFEIDLSSLGDFSKAELKVEVTDLDFQQTSGLAQDPTGSWLARRKPDLYCSKAYIRSY
jgi:hypothetical protein